MIILFVSIDSMTRYILQKLHLFQIYYTFIYL